PFKIVTEDLSAEKYVTASLVIPLTNLLKQEIEQTKTSTAIGVSVQNDLLKDQPNISRSSNALKFWIDSRHFTPVLSEIAVKYLISSATSVASERIASTINLLVPNNRSSQTAEHIKQRVFLKTLTEKYWYA
ncbi:hypothetical protein PV327_011373, partial [Microctonus hyperodae]